MTAAPAERTDQAADRSTDPDSSAAQSPTVLELTADQVAQHPDNVRDPGRDLKALTASVAQVGVIVPLIVVPVHAVPQHDFPPGTTHVAVDGNRRQAAARAAGLPLPCIVRADLASARDTAVTQAVTGLMRDGLTVTEEAGAVQTMLDLGLTAAVIGRATGRSRPQITAARKAAALTGDAADAAAGYHLSLDQLAVLADWQHDPDAVARLLDAAPRGQLPHVVARLQIEHREHAVYARVAADFTGRGLAITTDYPRAWGSAGPMPLSALRASTDTWEPLTVDQHADCPGHVAHLDVTIDPRDPRENEQDHDDGDDDSDEDGQIRDDTDADARIQITYACADPAGYGHLSRYGATRLPDTEQPDGEDDDGRAERHAREADERRTARRTLIRLNKEADAAQTVRREFLRHSLTVKSRHKAMTTWALTRVLHRDRTVARWLNEWDHPPVLGELLGCDDAHAVSAAAAAPPTRHPVMLWTYVAAAYEHEFRRDAHRCVDPDRAAYLRHLAALGYPLSAVEQTVIDQVSTPSVESDSDEPDPRDPDSFAADEFTARIADLASDEPAAPTQDASVGVADDHPDDPGSAVTPLTDA